MNLGHVTIFKPLAAVHLFKDIGLFAAGLAKVDHSIATVIHGGADEVEVPLQLRPWVKTCRIPNGRGWRGQWALLRFLKRGGAQSVTLYHATREHLVLAWLLRMAGLKVYLKLDMNGTTAQSLTSTWLRTWRPSSWIVKALFGAPHLVSCEDLDVYRQLKNFPWAARRLQLIPNAMLAEAAPMPSSATVPRRNVIVIAGRLGAEEKNYEMVLRAFAEVPPDSMHDWQLHCCGPSTPAFREMLSDLTAARPDLARAIVLRGELNRSALFDTYLQCKVLLVTSRFEGFSLAALEAAWAGCFLASTPVGGMTQLTDGWRLGYRLVDDNACSLAEFLTLIANNGVTDLDAFERRQAYIHREFSLEHHVTRILATLRNEAFDQ